mmetsp:Transcript_16055/g.17703  ORF Transcript_16055/g.17703 Transcript_16055/m.17703 type:complete len:465 (-) Transcript_16055:84-1478(-)
MFKYVFIPADASEPISIVKASKSGGLTNDELIKQARKYFIENTNERNQKKSDNDINKQSDNGTSDIDPECLKRIELLEKATPQEKKQIADRIRTQYSKGGRNTVGVTAVEGGAAAVVTDRVKEDDGVSDEDRATLESKISSMDDDEVIQLLKLQEQQKMQQESSSSSSSMTSCEITCLTIPTKLNQHTAVSMYGDDTARTKNYTFNTRATNLMTACGHAFPQNSSASSVDGSPRNTVVMGGEEDGKPNGMYGDVFVGRSIDDETNDIWERVDLLPEEVGGNSNSSSGIATVSELNKIAWCKIAKKKGGGGGMGGGRGGSAPSLKNTIQKFQQAAMTEATSSAAATSSNSTSTPTITNVDDDGNDIQDEDELNYTWIQTNEELELKFVVPITTTTKQVQVKFGMKSLTVTLNNVVLCEGDLWDEIDVDGSTYTFQNENKSKQTKEICVSLEKHNQGQTWNYVIEE